MDHAAVQQDEVAPVTIATYPNPHEAQLAHAALASQGISSFVNNDHGQYASAGAWVHLQVAHEDRTLARSLLEQGPLVGAAEPPPAGSRADDMRSLRLQRHFTLARWFLYAGALTFSLAWLLLPVSVALLGLALWSRNDPRRAFGVAFALQSIAAVVYVATSGVYGLGSLVPLLAFYFAWTAAAPRPPERFVASPIPSTPAIDIGDAWTRGGTDREPPERPIPLVHALGGFLIVVGVLGVVWFVSQIMRYS